MNPTHALAFALAAASLLIPCSNVRAELVQARLEGFVDSSPIPALNGQPWVLTLVLDTAAPESPASAPHPSFATHFNNGPVKFLRLVDFSVGQSIDFTIHLVDPEPAPLESELDVFCLIENFDSKTFSTHVDAVALLPAWNGLQITNFQLRLEDVVPGGFADGTDRLPGPDQAITIDEFSDRLVRITLGPAGQLIGTASSIALTAVPELSPGTGCAAGGLAMLLLKRPRRPRETRST